MATTVPQVLLDSRWPSLDGDASGLPKKLGIAMARWRPKQIVMWPESLDKLSDEVANDVLVCLAADLVAARKNGAFLSREAVKSVPQDVMPMTQPFREAVKSLEDPKKLLSIALHHQGVYLKDATAEGAYNEGNEASFIVHLHTRHIYSKILINVTWAAITLARFVDGDITMKQKWSDFSKGDDASPLLAGFVPNADLPVKKSFLPFRLALAISPLVLLQKRNICSRTIADPHMVEAWDAFGRAKTPNIRKTEALVWDVLFDLVEHGTGIMERVSACLEGVAKSLEDWSLDELRFFLPLTVGSGDRGGGGEMLTHGMAGNEIEVPLFLSGGSSPPTTHGAPTTPEGLKAEPASQLWGNDEDFEQGGLLRHAISTSIFFESPQSPNAWAYGGMGNSSAPYILDGSPPPSRNVDGVQGASNGIGVIGGRKLGLYAEVLPPFAAGSAPLYPAPHLPEGISPRRVFEPIASFDEDEDEVSDPGPSSSDEGSTNRRPSGGKKRCMAPEDFLRETGPGDDLPQDRLRRSQRQRTVQTPRTALVTQAKTTSHSKKTGSRGRPRSSGPSKKSESTRDASRNRSRVRPPRKAIPPPSLDVTREAPSSRTIWIDALTSGHRQQTENLDVHLYNVDGSLWTDLPAFEAASRGADYFRQALLACHENYRDGKPAHLSSDSPLIYKTAYKDFMGAVNSGSWHSLLESPSGRLRHVLLTDAPMPSTGGSFGDALDGLCRIFNRGYLFQDLSESEGDRLVSLDQVQQASGMEEGKSLRGYDLPGRVLMDRPVIFDTFHFLHALCTATNDNDGSAWGGQDLEVEWSAVSTRGAHQGVGMEPSGLGTVVVPVYGSKLWVVGELPPDRQARPFGEIKCAQGDGSYWEPIVLSPGSILIMQPHALYTTFSLTSVVMHGKHFCDPRCLEDSMLTIMTSVAQRNEPQPTALVVQYLERLAILFNFLYSGAGIPAAIWGGVGPKPEHWDTVRTAITLAVATRVVPFFVPNPDPCRASTRGLTLIGTMSKVLSLAGPCRKDVGGDIYTPYLSRVVRALARASETPTKVELREWIPEAVDINSCDGDDLCIKYSGDQPGIISFDPSLCK